MTLQVVNIFNLFIAYGDTFLKRTSMYDELYYELNREEKIFSEIHACGKLITFDKRPSYIFKLFQCFVTPL